MILLNPFSGFLSFFAHFNQNDTLTKGLFCHALHPFGRRYNKNNMGEVCCAMGSVYDLKPVFQRLLQPVLQLLVRYRVTPNQITWVAIALSGLGGLMLWGVYFDPIVLLLMPVILFIRMALNALDGMMARQYNQATPLGEILNEVGDVVSDTWLYLPFLALVPHRLSAMLAVVGFVLLGMLCELTGILAKAMVGQRRYDGPMGKSDRAFAIGLMSLMLYFWPGFAKPLPSVFMLLDILLIISCWNRLKAIVRHAAAENRETAS